MTTASHHVEIRDLQKGRVTFSANHDLDYSALRWCQLSVIDKNNQPQQVSSEFKDMVLEFSLDTDWIPIRRFRLTDSGGNEVYVAENLFPATNNEFEKQFKSARDRSGDPRIDQFVAGQIFDHFTGEDGYRISAAVVASYKAIELLDGRLLDAAERMLLKSLALLPVVKMGRSARNNREHLHVSVLCTLYHVYLARGRHHDFLDTLLALKSLLEEKKFEFYFNLAYNACLSLRLLTVLYRRADRPEEARTASLLAFDLFKLSVHDADNNMAHFKELGYVHQNTYDAMRIGRRMKEVSEPFANRTVRTCLRVSAADHPAASRRMLSTFNKTIEYMREPKAT